MTTPPNRTLSSQLSTSKYSEGITPNQPNKCYISTDQFDLFPRGFELEVAIIRDLCDESCIVFSQIDHLSLKMMSVSLRFANVTTLSEAQEMNLSIIPPPSAIFHTWFAVHWTTIFDGTNNKQGLDYVSRIKHQATLYESWGLPLFIVYTERSLTSEQILEMESVFSAHPNIVTLSIESDLRTTKMVSSYQRETHYRRHLDGIRSSVMMDFPDVLDALKKKAMLKGKKELIERLNNLNKQSVMYLDIDNQLLAKPTYLLGCNGIINTAQLEPGVETAVSKQVIEHVPKFQYENTRSSPLPVDERYLAELNMKAKKALSVILKNGLTDPKITFMSDRNFFAISDKGRRAVLGEAEKSLPNYRAQQHDFATFDEALYKLFPAGLLRTKVLKLSLIQQVPLLTIGADRGWQISCERMLIDGMKR